MLLTLSDRINCECRRLEKKISSIELQVKELPEGRLIGIKNGKYTKWYVHDGIQERYIKKENYQLIKELAQKKYLTLQLEDLQQELTALNTYMMQHQYYTNKASKLLNDDIQFHNLIESNLSPQSKALQDWLNKPYERNTKNPEQLIHRSISGNVVRSKSEALIDMALYQNQIPYRYECPLILNETILYPDFTIKHPETGKIMYWEHFGMMDNPAYYKNVSNKLQLYFACGIIPSLQLITTYETVDHPLTSEDIEKVIENYFM